MKRQQRPADANASVPAIFGFAYNPISSAAFGSLPTLDFRVDSLGDAYFM